MKGETMWKGTRKTHAKAQEKHNRHHIERKHKRKQTGKGVKRCHAP